MPNEWGDTLVAQPAKTNEWGDTPVSSSVNQWGDAPAGTEETFTPEEAADIEKIGDLKLQIAKSQAAAKSYTTKANIIGNVATAIDLPGAVHNVFNLIHAGSDKVLNALGVPDYRTAEQKANPEYPNLVTPEQVGKIAEFLSPFPAGTLPQDEFTEGVQEGFKNLGSSLTSPENLTLAAVGAKFPGSVGAGFAGTMIGDIPAATEQLINAQTPKERGEATVRLTANVVGPKLIQSGLQEKPATQPTILSFAPATAEALKETIKETPQTEPVTSPAPATEATLNRLEAETKAPEAIPKAEVTTATVPAEPTVVSTATLSPESTGILPSPVSLAIGSATGKLAEAPEIVRGTLKTAAGETMPKTTIIDRPAGEAGARYGSSPYYAHYAARALSEEVLPVNNPKEPGYIDPKQFGALYTEDALRGRRQEFLRQAAAATDPKEKADWLSQAADVGTLVGRFGVFKDDAAIRAFAARPEVQDAIHRVNSLYASELDPLAKEAGLDITNKPQGGGLLPPGSFINLFVPREGGLPSRTTVKTRPVPQLPTAGPLGPSAGTPKLTATLKKRSRFSLKRTGASAIYGVDFHDMVANAFGGFTEIARKNEFDRELVRAGLAKIQDESPGQGWAHFPYDKRQILGIDEGEVAWRKAVNKGIWVKNRIAKEYSNVSNVYRNEHSGTATRFLLEAASRFQMLGILDATFHSTALMRRFWEAPLGKTDTALSIIRPLEWPKRLSMLAGNIFAERLAKNQRLAELANIGALTGHGQVKPYQIIRRTVNFIEENVRLTLSDMFDQMVKDKIFEDTETGRREFINAGLQYNRRFQGPIVRGLRNTMIGPFVTAGRAGLARGIKRWFLQDWAPGQDPASKAWVAGNVLTKIAGTAIMIGALNYAITRKFTGRNGVPLGNVDTGKNDKNGRPITVPLANLLGSEMRGARALGVRAVAEGIRNDMTTPQVLDAMVKDSWNAISHPAIGPGAQAIYGAVFGRPTAIGAPDFPKAAPGSGQSQAMKNVGHALEELNPMLIRGTRNILSKASSGKIEPSEKSPIESIQSLVIQPGTKPMTNAERQKMMNAVDMNKYVDQVASDARRLPKAERNAYVRKRFKDDGMAIGLQGQAYRKLKEKGVFRYD